jgi:hypothetical protein
MRRVRCVRHAARPRLRGRVPEQIDETPVVCGGDQVARVRSGDGVDVAAVHPRSPDALHRPACRGIGESTNGVQRSGTGTQSAGRKELLRAILADRSTLPAQENTHGRTEGAGPGAPLDIAQLSGGGDLAARGSVAEQQLVGTVMGERRWKHATRQMMSVSVLDRKMSRNSRNLRKATSTISNDSTNARKPEAHKHRRNPHLQLDCIKRPSADRSR